MLGVVMSTQVVLYVLFGGSGTLIGAVIGTIVIEAVSFWLSNSYQDIGRYPRRAAAAGYSVSSGRA